jgi:IS5 family transposase
VAFHKKSGLRVEDMVGNRWVYRKLRNVRAGISCLKRTYGLARRTWRGPDHFKTYVWSSVVAYNLAIFARLGRPTPFIAPRSEHAASAGRCPTTLAQPYRPSTTTCNGLDRLLSQWKDA